MKRHLLTLMLAGFFVPLFAQVPVAPAPDQAALLKSSNAQLARNKKLVYDFWHDILGERRLELVDQYLAENYIQHNPNVPNGRAGFVEFFSKLPKPGATPRKTRPLVSITAEADRVVMAFVDTRPVDPGDDSRTYTTTWFDMFRVEDGKIVEHWDGQLLKPQVPQ